MRFVSGTVAIVDALVEQRTSIQHAIRHGSAVAPRFVGMTEGEVDAHYDADRRELDRLTVLNLVASAEGTLKVDYFRRVAERRKDTLSSRLSEMAQDALPKKQLRPDFDEGGILEVLKETKVMDNNIIGRYRECLRARHWVGHGRYWSKPVEVDQLDPDEVYDRADAMIRAMPA